MTDRRLVKCSVRLYEDDLEIIREHYQEFGYNRILRHITSRLAENIRNKREAAITALDLERTEND